MAASRAPATAPVPGPDPRVVEAVAQVLPLGATIGEIRNFVNRIKDTAT